MIKDLGVVVTGDGVLLALGPYEVRSAPFMLHTLKGAVLIVVAVVGLIARGTLSPAQRTAYGRTMVVLSPVATIWYPLAPPTE